MTRPANPMRGEATLAVDGKTWLLRPTFEALVAAEDELGSLFAMVERAAEGSLKLAEISAMLWHCLPADNRPDRATVNQAILEMGLVGAMVPLRVIFSQVLKGA